MPRGRGGKRLNPASPWTGCRPASPSDYITVPDDVEGLPFDELMGLAAKAGATFYGATDRESVLRRLRQLAVA